MKIELLEKKIVSSHDFESARCTIDAEDMKYIASLLRNNYSNPILATIREVYANAVDANAENGLDASSIVVSMPTSLNPNFEIRDYGKGLSKHDMFNLYTKYGKSTKRNDDKNIGGFGIGRLAPLSYSNDGFSITSFHNGEKRIYSLYINDDNDTKLDEIYCEPTSEKSGLLISVGVSMNADRHKFQSTAHDFFKYFDVLPIFKNLNSKISQDEKVVGASLGNNAKWYLANRTNYWSNNNHIIMGGIPYSLDLSQIKSDKIDWYDNLDGLKIFVPIGSVKLHHSRESIEYNNTSKKFLVDIMEQIKSSIEKTIPEEFKDFDCIREAKQKYKKLRHSLPHCIFDLCDQAGHFKFKGGVINSDSFTSYYYTNSKNKEARIPVSAKCYKVNDNDRITVRRGYSLSSDKGTAYVVNDIGSGAKVTPRIYNLFKSDGYLDVIVLSHDESIASIKDGDGADLFVKVNRMDLIKTGFYKLSELEETKIPRKSTKKSVDYNCDLFFTFGRYALSVADKNEVEDTNKIKPYISIKNRKIVDNEYAIYGDSYGNPSNTFFDNFKEAFETPIYAVSAAVTRKKSFQKQDDFVSVKDYILDYWENLSQENKNLVIDYAENYVYDGKNWSNLVGVSEKGSLKQVSEQEAKIKKIEDDLASAGILSPVKFIIYNCFVAGNTAGFFNELYQTIMNGQVLDRKTTKIIAAMFDKYEILKFLESAINDCWRDVGSQENAYSIFAKTINDLDKKSA